MSMIPHRWLCRCLAPDGLCPTAELTSTLDAPNFAWEPLLVLAHRHFIAAPWYAALQRRGLLERLPVEIGEHLAAIYTLSLERNRLLHRELMRMVRVLNALGIEPLLLKGALALLPDQPPEVAARLMGDLDVLAPTDAVSAAHQALQDQWGYRPAYPDWRFANHHHVSPLIHADHGVKIELHRTILGGAWDAALPTEEVWRDSQRLVWEGVIVRTPSHTHRVLHNLLHTLLQDGRAERGLLELRQLLDLVQFRASGDQTIDWPLIRARFTTLGQGAVLEAYLRVARDGFGQPLPDGTPSSLSAAWLKGKFEFGIRHPAAGRWFYWQMRLKRLPKRLATPAWYPAKFRAWRQGRPL